MPNNKRKSRKAQTQTIPLFLGTSYSYNPDKETKPLMTLVEDGELKDEKIYAIKFGPVKIGEVRLIGNSYSLHWLATGGNFCGRGELPVSGPTIKGQAIHDSLAQATLAAHIFEVLAADLREYIAESQ